jgi:lysophospholipase L1-like esterase
MNKRRFALVSLMGLLTASAALASPGDFPFHNGDRVVFLGDSITEQRLYTTYIETYLLTRFPTWKLQFRNAGWGGDTSWLRQRGAPADQALKRDVLDFHPTVVTIDFGMNDAGYGAFNQDLYDQHMKGERAIVDQIKAAGALPIVLTASAVEKTEPGDDMLGYNQNLQQFAAGDQSLAIEEKVPFADQLHPFAAAINRLRAGKADARLSGDVVHPGPAGHLMMADFILSGLNAPTTVSQVVIDAARGRVKSTRGAAVTDLVKHDGGIVFHRLDDAIVFPIQDEARPVLAIVPVSSDLDRYIVQVTGLAPGTYQIGVNGTAVTLASAAQLNDGVNLAYYASPLTARGGEILQHVYKKNNLYFDLWRNVQLGNQPDRATKTSDLNKQIADEEAQIDALRKPDTFEISILPVTAPKAPPVTGG